MSKTSEKTYVPFAFPDTAPGSEPNTHMKVEVFYSKGGTSMFSGNSEPRGYWASFTPVRVNDGSVSYLLFAKGGGKVFLAPAARFSAKTFESFVAKVFAKKDELATLAFEGNLIGAAEAAKAAVA